MKVRVLSAARWAGGRRLLLPLTAQLLCARTVRESAAFFSRQVARRDGLFLYRLRGSGLRVGIRHDTADPATLSEVFYHRHYEPGEDAARALSEPRRILDMGANIGLFGAFAAGRWPEAEIVAYEPDPANAAVLRHTVAANALQSRWTVVPAAAGTRDGEVGFALGLEVESHIVADTDGDGPAANTIILVPVRDVLAEMSRSDLVKLDIEGGEWDILGDERFAQNPPRALVLEYHPRLCPGADPRATIERLLTRADMRIAPIWHGADGHGMLWAWRP